MDDKDYLNAQSDYTRAVQEIKLWKKVKADATSDLSQGCRVGKPLEIDGKLIAGWKKSIYGERFQSIHYIKIRWPDVYMKLRELGIIFDSPDYLGVVVKELRG